MNRPKELLTIQQLSLKTGIPKSTLRFWEKELDGIIAPLRTDGRQRRYDGEHLAIIENIDTMRKSGMSLPAIGDKLRDKPIERDRPYDNGMEVLAERIAHVVKAEIHSFLQNDR